MPKVSQEYIENKKKKIVEAAYKVCLQKTVSTVTMQDVINETDMSQGGIYRFYSDVDEVLADMIDDLRKKSNIKEQLEIVLKRNEEMSVEKLVYAVFDMLGNYIDAEWNGIAKIDFELSILAMNAPKRVVKIMKNTTEIGNKEYIASRTTEIIMKMLSHEQITVGIGIEELMNYISSVYAGIQMNSIVSRCYKTEKTDVDMAKKQMRILAETVLHFIKK